MCRKVHRRNCRDCADPRFSGPLCEQPIPLQRAAELAFRRACIREVECDPMAPDNDVEWVVQKLVRDSYLEIPEPFASLTNEEATACYEAMTVILLCMEQRECDVPVADSIFDASKCMSSQKSSGNGPPRWSSGRQAYTPTQTDQFCGPHRSWSP